MDNATIANYLGRLAAALDLAGASPYSIRAYRRAADLIRATKPTSPSSSAGSRPRAARDRRGDRDAPARAGRDRDDRGARGAGTGNRSGARRDRPLPRPERQARVEIGRALGVRTADELREAAAAVRLTEVPGIGPSTEGRPRERLAREPRSEAPRLLLGRARLLMESLADALDATVAGDVRRWSDYPQDLALVATDASALERFAAAPNRCGGRAGRAERAGLTVEGVSVRLVIAPESSFGTELVRATGSGPYVAALGPLPAVAREEDLYAELGIPFCPPELREAPFRGEPLARRDRGYPRRPALPHHALGRPRVRATTWRSPRASGDTRTWRSATTRRTSASFQASPPTMCALQAEEIAGANEKLAPFRVLRGIECDILPDGSSTFPTTSWPSSLGAGKPARRPAPPRDVLTKQVLEAMRNPYVRGFSHPTGRYIGRRRRTRSTSGRRSRPRSRPASRWRSTDCRTGSISRVNTSGSRSRPERRSSSTPTRTRSRA